MCVDSSDVEIPVTLAACFQEYEFGRLDASRHAELVIERVLAFGNQDELRWVFNRYGHSRIEAWLRHLGHRRLPWRRYNLWCVLLGLPRRPRPTAIWPH